MPSGPWRARFGAPVSRRAPLPCPLPRHPRPGLRRSVSASLPPRGEAAAGSARADTTTRSVRCNAATGPPRPLVDRDRRRGRCPRRGGRHRVDCLVEQQFGSVVLDGRHFDPDDHWAVPLTVDTPSERCRARTTPTTSTPTTSTSTTVAVAPAGPPVISSLSPASGSAGQSVTVSGANFLSTSGQIVATFNGQVAPTSCPAQNTCTVTVPPSSAPSAQVVITTAGGASNAQTFTYD